MIQAYFQLKKSNKKTYSDYLQKETIYHSEIVFALYI